MYLIVVLSKKKEIPNQDGNRANSTIARTIVLKNAAIFTLSTELSSFRYARSLSRDGIDTLRQA